MVFYAFALHNPLMQYDSHILGPPLRQAADCRKTMQVCECYHMNYENAQWHAA